MTEKTPTDQPRLPEVNLTPERIAELSERLERSRHIWRQYEDSTRMYDDLLTALRRLGECERRLMRINAINDNPARFNKEIDELSTFATEEAAPRVTHPSDRPYCRLCGGAHWVGAHDRAEGAAP